MARSAVPSLGRPKKKRPALGSPISSKMSDRDICIALGISRRQIALYRNSAFISDREFSEMIESEGFEYAQFTKLARVRANKLVAYKRRCPHCGGVLKTEAI
jgi:hypothetical protein